MNWFRILMRNPFTLAWTRYKTRCKILMGSVACTLMNSILGLITKQESCILAICHLRFREFLMSWLMDKDVLNPIARILLHLPQWSFNAWYFQRKVHSQRVCFVKSMSLIYLDSLWFICSKSHENQLLNIILKNLRIDNSIRLWFTFLKGS